MRPTEKRIFITVIAAGLLATAFVVSATSGKNSLTTRIDNAIHDLEAVHSSIPHAALHAKALEILNARTVAADDDNLDPCVAFNKKPIAEGPCR